MSENGARRPASTQSERPPVFGPGRAGMMGGPAEKARDFRKTMRSLIGYLRPFWGAVIAVVLFALASTVFAIISPKILGDVTNRIVAGYESGKVYDSVMANLPAGVHLPPGTTGSQLLTRISPAVVRKIPAAQIAAIRSMDFSRRPGIDFGAVARTAELLIVLYVLSALFNYIKGWIMAGVSQQVTFDLRRDISLKINRLPLRYFDRRTHGEVLSRVTNDVDTVSQTLNQSLTQLVTSATTIIGILAMMLSISWEMTLVALLILPLSLGLVRTIISKSQGYFVQQQVSLGKINGHVEEMFSGHAVMKVFNGEERSVATFRSINTELYDSAWRSQFLSSVMMPMMSFVGNLGYVGVAVMGGWLALRGRVNIGDIQAFIQYMNQFTQPITQTANIANVLQSTAAAAERVFEFLAEEEQVEDVAHPVSPRRIAGRVEFDHVVFGYTPDKTVIKDFNAVILPGQRAAIVGPTGAGKTTIVNLLMRFYDVNQGAIKVDGIDIREMRRSDMRRIFGMVLQDTWLFSGTIEENIAYGKAGASHDEVVAAAKAAHADHFIRALPGGYQMELNEEADNISQGEKQLLTIARAMLADTPILILDEATSSVDTRTEALIQLAMEKLIKGRTSFVIAHRLSTIRTADLILVMRDGNIVEQGTHEALLSQNGFYASLYYSQFATNVQEDLL